MGGKCETCFYLIKTKSTIRVTIPVMTGHIKYALVIARFRVQYGQYFPSFSYFADLFHEPLGECLINENMLLTNGRFKFRFKVCDRLLKLTVTIPAEDP